MPNPLFLKVMGIDIHRYNSYSPEKKARFQADAQKKLVELQQKPERYAELTDAHETETVEPEGAEY